MRKLCTIVTAIGVGVSPMAWADPLAPGKPAGVRQAQMTDKELLVFGGVAAVVAGVLIATNGSGDHAAVVTQPISVITTSATTG